MTRPAVDEDDVDGFEVTDEIEIDSTDLDEQKDGSQAIEPVKKVMFEIRKADIRETEHGPVGEKQPAVKSLHVEAAIGLGIDSTGRYKGKVFFPEFIVWFDLAVLKAMHAEAVANGKKKGKAFNERWWLSEAKFPIRQFALAIGIVEVGEDGKLSKFPKINDKFLESLKGTCFLADIKKVKDAYKGEGYFKNELANYAKVSIGGDEEEDE